MFRKSQIYSAPKKILDWTAAIFKSKSHKLGRPVFLVVCLSCSAESATKAISFALHSVPRVFPLTRRRNIAVGNKNKNSKAMIFGRWIQSAAWKVEHMTNRRLIRTNFFYYLTSHGHGGCLYSPCHKRSHMCHMTLTIIVIRKSQKWKNSWFWFS